MRPIEIILSCAILLAFFSCVIVLSSTITLWMRYAVPVALLIAAVQVSAEGPRWQMVSAYVLVVLLFLIWLLGLALPGGVDISPPVSVLGTIAGALALVVSTALPILLPVFHFPEPTGPYAIGTVAYHWADPSRPELFTPDPTDHRELMAQVWYPARSEPSAPRWSLNWTNTGASRSTSSPRTST